MTNIELLTGKQIFPDYIHSDDFGDALKSISGLVVGNTYIIWEPGLDVWQAEYAYKGVVNGEHLFESNIQFSNNVDVTFTDAQLEEYIADEHIFEQEV